MLMELKKHKRGIIFLFFLTAAAIILRWKFWVQLLLFVNMFLIVVLIIVAVIAISFFYRLENKIKHPLVLLGELSFLFLFASLLINLYAEIYFISDAITDGTKNYKITQKDAMYFSAVTFTTLGYGDFKPKPDFRHYAAYEAIIGYTYLGVLVAYMSQSFSKHNLLGWILGLLPKSEKKDTGQLTSDDGT